MELPPDFKIAGVDVYVFDDRCYVRLERLLTFMPDTATRVELLSLLWQRDTGEVSS